ncbi:hypothetical protein HHX47_DHR1001259 [Lentinula edodes]|nr:hypothetical protein HHX47_DHR1001259 [Lentinula edodes]
MLWRNECLQLLFQELSDDTQRTTSQLLGCGKENVVSLLSALSTLDSCTYESCGALESLINISYEEMSHGASGSCWPRLYTDASIIRSLASLNSSSSRAAIDKLDRVIIIAGAAGEGRLDLVHTLIRRIQTEFLSYTVDLTRRFSKPEVIASNDSRSSISSLKTSLHVIPVLNSPPSFTTFHTTHNHHPFVLPKYASSWPAINEHPWSSAAYLRFVAGPARIVPVEVGADYRADDWTQQFIDWDRFLSTLELDDIDLSADLASPSKIKPKKVLYLAQHNLIRQFPDLNRDIVIPDYVYTCPQPPLDYPQYKPPGNDEQLVINTWLGPLGTISPAHTREEFTLTGASSPVSCIQVVRFAILRTKTQMYRVAGPNDQSRSFALTRSRTRQDWERAVSRSLEGVPMEVASAGGSSINPVGETVCFQEPFVQKIQGNQDFCKMNRHPSLILGGRLLGNHRAAFQLEMTFHSTCGLSTFEMLQTSFE